jgi:hypothetical protein
MHNKKPLLRTENQNRLSIPSVDHCARPDNAKSAPQSLLAEQGDHALRAAAGCASVDNALYIHRNHAESLPWQKYISLAAVTFERDNSERECGKTQHYPSKHWINVANSLLNLSASHDQDLGTEIPQK